MYNSREISRNERDGDAQALIVFIGKLSREYEGWAEPCSMDNWKCLICSYFNNAFTLGDDDKRFDGNYHRSMFDIMYKDYDMFEVVDNPNNKVKLYRFSSTG
jgi:hypothetical protein